MLSLSSWQNSPMTSRLSTPCPRNTRYPAEVKDGVVVVDLREVAPSSVPAIAQDVASHPELGPEAAASRLVRLRAVEGSDRLLDGGSFRSQLSLERPLPSLKA